jgi:predicted transcriptional regulator
MDKKGVLPVNVQDADFFYYSMGDSSKEIGSLKKSNFLRNFSLDDRRAIIY